MSNISRNWSKEGCETEIIKKSGKEIEYKKCKFSSIAVKIMEKSVVKLN